MAVWLEFKLADHKVTYMSFYRYARRVRDRANVAELASLDEETDTNINPALNKLAARQLLKMLMNENEFDPRVLSTLTATLRRLSSTEHQERRLADASSVAREKLDLLRAELKLKSDHLDLLRRRFESTLAPSAGRLPKSSTGHFNGRLMAARVPVPIQ